MVDTSTFTKWLLPIGAHTHTFALLSGEMPMCFCGVKADEYVRKVESPGYGFTYLGRMIVEMKEVKGKFHCGRVEYYPPGFVGPIP